MKDVAALAGVGLMTVSRVVNGKPGVSPVMTARVLDAIEELDYRHNVSASNLRRLDGKTGTIGLVLENVANPFMGAIYRAVEDHVRAHGMLVFTGSCDEDGAREREFISALRARRVDGLIIVPADRDHSYLRSEQRRGTAIVFVDRPPRFLDADFVMSDNVAGARAATTQLTALGHRRIAYLGGPPDVATGEERLRGYAEALAVCGIAADPAIILTGLAGLGSTIEVERAVVGLLRGPDPPTAFFCALSYFTIDVIKAIRSLDLQHEVALIGFDDFPLADVVDPGVTVVRQDPTCLGQAAAKLLLRRLDGDTSKAKQVRLPVELIPRGSGEIPAPTSTTSSS
jgi:LacI family transcriptional regulator, galactose operon repressor